MLNLLFAAQESLSQQCQGSSGSAAGGQPASASSGETKVTPSDVIRGRSWNPSMLYLFYIVCSKYVLAPL